MLELQDRIALKEQITSELQQWQQCLENSLPVAAVEPGAGHFHPADGGTIQEIMTANGNTRQTVNRRIRDLEQALTMIDKKDYGQCRRCHDEIPVRRLESVPTALLCVTCKNQEEKGLLLPV